MWLPVLYPLSYAMCAFSRPFINSIYNAPLNIKPIYQTSSHTLTDKIPLSVGREAGYICLHHLQVHSQPIVCPRAKLQLAFLCIKGEPAHIDVAGALKDPWCGEKHEKAKDYRQGCFYTYCNAPTESYLRNREREKLMIWYFRALLENIFKYSGIKRAEGDWKK